MSCYYEDLAAAQQNGSESNDSYEEQLQQLEQDYESTLKVKVSKKRRVSFKLNKTSDGESDDGLGESSDLGEQKEANTLVEITNRKKNKKSKNTIKLNFNQLLTEDSEDNKLYIFALRQKLEAMDDDEDWSSNKKGGKRNKGKKQPTTQKHENGIKPAKKDLPQEAVSFDLSGISYKFGIEHFCSICEYNFFGPEYKCFICGKSFVTEKRLLSHLKKTKHTALNPDGDMQRFSCNLHGDINAHAYTRNFNKNV